VKQPNILVILIDDLGKEWLGCCGGEGIETPQIDKLASEGMKFTNAWSMPQCTPGRACLLTGQYPFRSGRVNHRDASRRGVAWLDWQQKPSDARTVQAAGCKTAVAGKWQLNDLPAHPEAPNMHDFDDYCLGSGCEGSTAAEDERKSAERYWDPCIDTRAGSKTHTGPFGPDI
jgi:arylsulfatase A-like enzyme